MKTVVTGVIGADCHIVGNQARPLEVFEDDVKNSWQGASEFLLKRGKIKEAVNLEKSMDVSFAGKALGKRYPLQGHARAKYEYAKL